MPEITDAIKDAMLETMLGGEMTLALLHGDQEESDSGYLRQRARFTPDGGEYVNSDLVEFGPYAAAAHSPVTGYAVYNASGFVSSDRLIVARQPMRSDSIFFRAGDLRVRII